jgi:hypothetical protein
VNGYKKKAFEFQGRVYSNRNKNEKEQRGLQMHLFIYIVM